MLILVESQTLKNKFFIVHYSGIIITSGAYVKKNLPEIDKEFLVVTIKHILSVKPQSTYD